jgi:thiamine-monophosphate kinase
LPCAVVSGSAGIDPSERKHFEGNETDAVFVPVSVFLPKDRGVGSERRGEASLARVRYNRGMAGEFDFIEWVRSQQARSEMVPVPAGDDLAVVKWPGGEELMLVGTDQVLDGVHFDSKVHSPRAIGRKVMNRNLSDCAAMACLPVAAVGTVALPRGVGMEYVKELYLGLKEAGAVFGCEIVGGDTASWEGKLAITVSIVGRSGGIKPVTRSGAKPTQHIYVTGPLGGSLLGRHMTFVPRIHEARALAETGAISSMIDISDGLSRDIGHICRQSGVGAILIADQIPVHEDAIEMRRDGHSPLEHALHDGEDHELLFTTSELVPEGMGILIGATTGEPGVRLKMRDGEVPLEPKGWEHTL